MVADETLDILVAGGGLVGASLACAVARPGLRTAMVDPAPATSAAAGDPRVIALSEGSRRILTGLGAWPGIAPHATPIRSIHVSQRGHFGVTRLRAADAGVEALGYVVPAADLLRVLMDCVRANADIEFIPGARVVGFVDRGDDVLASLNGAAGPRQRGTRLLVAADGGRSLLREAAGIGTREWGYTQAAVVTVVETEQGHANVAYERFTDSGPMALLPMADRRSALVWTVREGEQQVLLDLDDGAFLARLEARFGGRLGRFVACGPRSAFPLSLVRSRDQYRGRLVVIGNAAHTLHPVAGQGLNLGLRDVAALSERVVDAWRMGGDPGADAVLSAYADWRRADQRNVSAFSDLLVRVFSNRFAPLSLLRSLGLTALDLLPPAKRLLTHHAMGLGGRQTRLGRGLPL